MRRFVIGVSVVPLLLSMVVVGVVPAAGADIEKGKKVYDEKRCSSCHAIGGKGGKIGPDLSDVGSKRDGEWLTKFFKDPKGTVPGSKHMVVKVSDADLSDLVAYMGSLKK